MVTAKLVIEEGVSFQGSCNTSPKSASNEPSSKKDDFEAKDEAKALQEKIEEVAEELAKK